MLFFLVAETMFFAGLISAFFVLRLGAPVWPPPLQPRLPVLVTGLNTLVLLASSLAMIAALRALRRGAGRALVERLAATAALGALFLAVQGYEWARLIHYGLTVTSGAYGATFYTLIGFHAAPRAGRAGVAHGRAGAGRARALRRRPHHDAARLRDLLALRGRRCGRSSTSRCTWYDAPGGD